MLDDDAVIAQSWQQPERFAVLFDRHAAYIHRYIARRAGPQAAEDLVAETFLTAFRKRRRYQHGYANARPWLYGIATHLVGQHHRDQARQHRLHQAAGPAPDAPDFFRTGGGACHGDGDPPGPGRGAGVPARQGPGRAAADRLGGAASPLRRSRSSIVWVSFPAEAGLNPARVAAVAMWQRYGYDASEDNSRECPALFRQDRSRLTPAPPAARPAGLTRRIRLMRRKWATI